MVLYKRKQMTLLPPPDNLADHVEVFTMKGTGEVFIEYEKYLKRLDYLNQKKFTDAVNGKSGLTYFDAVESESKSSTAIESVFPEVLKDPILRRVQFSVISRVDDLVSTVFDEFKRDFFPGETVNVTVQESDVVRMEGVIREKAKFPMIRGPNGEIQRAAFSRYFVRVAGMPDYEMLLDDARIRRDRKVFTKQNLRSFLKHSLQREAWNGAPWLVKEHLAIFYRLPMEIPAHLLQDAKLLRDKQAQMLPHKPVKGRRPKGSGDFAPHGQMMPPQQHPGVHPDQMQNYHNAPVPAQNRPPPPPPIKYPIEDLDVAPKRNGVTRPEPNFWTEEMREWVVTNRRTTFDHMEMASMGLLLEVWNTLNVQCEVYLLDSFTFDDFVDAMEYKADDPPCELLDEVHCAVLKQLVDDKGKLMIKMAEIVDEEEEEESEDAEDESAPSTPQVDAPAHSTRSRLSHVDSTNEHLRSLTTEKLHCAAEMLAGRNWKARLADRDFEDGGWQVILVGLLHQLSASPGFKSRSDRVLEVLAPVGEDPTQETARLQYLSADVNIRIKALQIITMLSIGTKAVREFLEQCSEDMTDVRKRKIEHQRERKTLHEELLAKDRDRKILLPQNMPESPKAASAEPVSTNDGFDMDDTLETNGTEGSDPDDDAPAGRSLRRGNDRKRKREEENARLEKEKVEKAAAAKAQNKQSKEFKKLLVEIEELKRQIVDHEAKIADCDGDLREANVQRTKLLGQDRFCNRYYWYERNGQPFGGLPNSSTSSYGYANGRVWIQGPDNQEIDGFIGSPEDQKEYKARFSCTINERRSDEEGRVKLKDANDWAFYDDPIRLDNLIGWLEDRGVREKKLRKELCEWRDTIAQYMEAFKNFKDMEKAKKVEADEEHASRISTRHKAHEDQIVAQERCLRWSNTMALGELGHLHSQKPPKVKERKKAAAAAAPPPQQKGVAAVVTNRHGKPLTRQGGSYNFK